MISKRPPRASLNNTPIRLSIASDGPIGNRKMPRIGSTPNRGTIGAKTNPRNASDLHLRLCRRARSLKMARPFSRERARSRKMARRGGRDGGEGRARGGRGGAREGSERGARFQGGEEGGEREESEFRGEFWRFSASGAVFGPQGLQKRIWDEKRITDDPVT